MAGYFSGIDKDDWYLVWTKPRQEQRAKEQLMNQGVEVFLPAVSTHRIKKNDEFEPQNFISSLSIY